MSKNKKERFSTWYLQNIKINIQYKSIFLNYILHKMDSLQNPKKIK